MVRIDRIIALYLSVVNSSTVSMNIENEFHIEWLFFNKIFFCYSFYQFFMFQIEKKKNNFYNFRLMKNFVIILDLYWACFFPLYFCSFLICFYLSFFLSLSFYLSVVFLFFIFAFFTISIRLFSLAFFWIILQSWHLLFKFFYWFFPFCVT